MKLTGPFTQILPLLGMPLKGAITDDQLRVIPEGGVLTENGVVKAIENFEKLRKANPHIPIDKINGSMVLIPGFIDCHTHLCFAGNRANDYALRLSGQTYRQIAASGGGIWDTVVQTRNAGEKQLTDLLLARVQGHLSEGVTTIEVKSGYGLNAREELKQLRAIRVADTLTPAHLVPTCLAAHLLPKDFNHIATEYLAHLVSDLLPQIQREELANRVDIFVEEGAFTIGNAQYYLSEAKRMGFDLTVHADQFTTGGSAVAVKTGAASADHLEASAETECKLLAGSNTAAVVLPGASLGLGMPFAPARKLLDAGACLAIASDWNPGSAPMGDLLTQAALLGAAERLTTAETLAGLTYRAAQALRLDDRGTLTTGMLADMQAYPCADYREILYYQGKMKPARVWKNGKSL